MVCPPLSCLWLKQIYWSDENSIFPFIGTTYRGKNHEKRRSLFLTFLSDFIAQCLERIGSMLNQIITAKFDFYCSPSSIFKM